ncbi:MAG: hypothetical protein JO097_15285 [Acidobacteriaceae bacterium]|nr:hypothetical protein [Acidobacteriaceae bacterium]MBV9297304.1 hypothetical protein [Acidobacteriaceae bacterium]MBV9763783.1 hypothetical protein [Acidobacteriaceae bacterium]
MSKDSKQTITRRELGAMAAVLMAPRMASADACSDYTDLLCNDGGAPSVPGRLHAAWLVHTTGHCLDDFLFGNHPRKDIRSCMNLDYSTWLFLSKKLKGEGLDQAALTDAHKKFPSPVDAAFYIVGLVWTSILNDPQIKGVFPKEFADGPYGDHACPRTSDLFKLAQSGVFTNAEHTRVSRKKGK